MGLLGSLTMLFLLISVSWLPDLGAQSANESSSAARSLDALLQDYAYKGFGRRPKTGVQYDGVVPSNLTGIKIAALRLRNGSFRKRRVPMYKEFAIPSGVAVKPYVKRLVLVYQNLGNWSEFYYPIPGYSYLAPVVGLLAYDAKNLSFTNLLELSIRATKDPISVVFSDLESPPDGFAVKCVRFDLQGLVIFSDVLLGNSCSTIQQGHFSIVVESVAAAPSPVFPAPTPGEVPAPSGGKEKKSSTKVWIVVGSVLGGLLLLAVLSFLILWAQKYKHKKRMQQMETAAEVGEPLHMTSVGDTRAPAATITRTQPMLENEYVP